MEHRGLSTLVYFCLLCWTCGMFCLPGSHRTEAGSVICMLHCVCVCTAEMPCKPQRLCTVPTGFGAQASAVDSHHFLAKGGKQLLSEPESFVQTQRAPKNNECVREGPSGEELAKRTPTHPLMMTLSSNRYTLMCWTPMVSLKRCGTSSRSSPLRSGVWYRDTRICEVKRCNSGSSMVLELTCPAQHKNQRTQSGRAGRRLLNSTVATTRAPGEEPREPRV